MRIAPLEVVDGLVPGSQHAYKYTLAGGRLYDPTPATLRTGSGDELVRKSDRLAEPVHDDGLQFGASRTCCLKIKKNDY